jgi:hypothetical protein
MARVLGQFALLFLAPLTAMAQSGYTDDMCRRGLANQSSAPLFVLVTLVDTKSGSERTACVDAPFLLGSIHIEHQLPYDDAGISKAVTIALNQPSRRFTFKHPKARANVEPTYDPEIADSMREKLTGKSDTQLREGLETYKGDLHLLYRYKGGLKNESANLHAVCQVLLERGILVGHTDGAYQLYLAE